MDPSLLDSRNADADALLGKLLQSGIDPSQLMAGMGLGGDTSEGPERKTADGIPYVRVTPSPGFCVKLKSKTADKVFYNICHSDMVPPTKDITDDELLKVLESDDMTQFRIPMCIGEPHAEVDKSGGGCTVYDIIVHTDFLRKLQTSDLFKTFFLTIACEGIEEKFQTDLKRDWVILKNRRSIGKLQEQTVRTKSKPLIMDMEHGFGQGPGAVPEPRAPGLIQEMEESPKENKQAPEPKFSIVKEPAEGHPEFLVAEIHLPLVKSAQTLTLDMGEDRILLETRSNVYRLDVYLPYDIAQEDVGAQFDRSTKILTLTMPVQPEL